MIKVSVIIPIYNMEKYISNSLENLMNQTFTEFEVILVNDGSTDNSEFLCDEFAKRDKRVQVIHKKNEGAGYARNKGIEVATGKYLVFIDIDDILEVNMLEKMYYNIEKYNVDLVICNHNSFKDDKKIKLIKNINENIKVDGTDNCRKTYLNLLKESKIQTPWDKIYKSEIIKSNNLKFPNMKRCQDAAFNCLYFNYVNSYKIIKDSLYNYRENNMKLELLKFPKNYFEIILELDGVYNESISSWGMLDKEAERYLANFLVNSVIQCIRFSFSPKWELSNRERKKYLKKIVENNRVINAIDIYVADSRYCNIIGRFIKRKQITRIILVTKVNIFFKLNMSNVFIFLKKRFN